VKTESPVIPERKADGQEMESTDKETPDLVVSGQNSDHRFRSSGQIAAA
jgi:hypothetical protein